MGSLGHEKHLKQMSENTKNQKNSSKISVDQKLIIFKKLINDGPFYICVVCQRCLYKKSVFCLMKINLSHKCHILIW